jgi:hypothetical protein
VISLLGAHIAGQLDCGGAELRNDSGPALNGQGLQVGQHVFLRYGFTPTGGGSGMAVDLKAARMAGQFQFAPARLEQKDDSHRRLVARMDRPMPVCPSESLRRTGAGCCGRAPQAMPRSRISSWPPGSRL